MSSIDTPFDVFRLIAKDMNGVGDDEVNAYIELVSPIVSKKKFGKLYDQAVALLAAHRMKMMGVGEVAESDSGTIGDSLRVASYSEGETSISYSANQATSVQPDAEYGLTEYGLQYLNLRRMVIIPIHISGEN